ncbi:hypothetical protein O6H91_07G065800 [Diphasiastrum complanatum]|uniref:Uncharacterized protein n=1 Tax=Diphasiastrum complanatum TaxID=34168 RepID=A0ACC2D706_DIPCM|nr:hypothetical protein O6H91_07G065800 [Diphasiastrum complanatum]
MKKAEFQRILQYQQIFQVEETRYDDLQMVAEEVEMKHALWTSLEDLGRKSTLWASVHFEKLNFEEVEEVVQRYTKLAVKLERGLLPNKVVGCLRNMVDEFRLTLPVIQNLRNKALKDRHWKKIEVEIGHKLERNVTFTLGRLLELKVMDYKGAIGNISNEATQEASLEELLQKVQNKWTTIELAVKPYKDIKDVYVLGGVDDVIAALEDSMVTMSTVTSSRYVAGIRTEVEKLENQLKHFGQVLDEWLECQKQWMYLESIFSAPDIQRQLPNESKAFNAVDKQFKEIMKRTHDRPNALQAGSAHNIFETFQKSNETLEKIQKNLEDYLETKRMAFPRFYFLSNDELLEILAQTRNVQAVQAHMSKCFGMHFFRCLQLQNRKKCYIFTKKFFTCGHKFAD